MSAFIIRVNDLIREFRCSLSCEEQNTPQCVGLM